jgi:hypothetical protein
LARSQILSERHATKKKPPRGVFLFSRALVVRVSIRLPE